MEIEGIETSCDDTGAAVIDLSGIPDVQCVQCVKMCSVYKMCKMYNVQFVQNVNVYKMLHV